MDAADRYALVPDPADQSGWRLPIWNEDGTPHVAGIRRALGALRPDASPTIPHRLARAVRARIRAAWEAAGLGKFPDVLAKADSFDPAALDSLPSGVMVAFGLDADVAAALALPVDGAEPVEALHVTLAYLGPVALYSGDDVATLAAVLRRFAIDRSPLAGKVTGPAVFAPDQPDGEAAGVALIDCPGISAFRSDLAACLAYAGFPPLGDHDFIPHVTLAYGDQVALQQLPFPPTVPVAFDSLILAAGGQVERFPLDGRRLADVDEAAATMITMGPVLRSAGEKRYTFAPLYVPNSDDSHGEYATADDLQKAVWDWTENGARTLNLMHIPGTKAGRIVEMCTWPAEATFTMASPGGASQEVTFPAGTVYMGAVWEPWAWERAKRGELKAFSLEGQATRVVEVAG